MGDVLSQSEIDNLLNALSSGELDVDEIKENSEQTVKDYDFARPSKFSKEHLRTLEIIFEHYGRLLTTNLPVYLRKSVQVEVMNSEAVTYSEFTNALSNPVLLGIVNFAPLHGNIIVEMASGLGYAIVDRMLGGRGDSLDKTREFSEIELLIIERILVICINLLQEPWQNVLDISPHLERIETNSQYAQIISPSEVIAIITMNIKIGDDDDKIRLNQRKPSKYKGLRRFGPEKNLQRINKFMKERPIFYKNLIQMKENIRFYLRCFYCITKVMILQFNSENRTELARNG